MLSTRKLLATNIYVFLAILKIYNEIRIDTIYFKDILIEMGSIAWIYICCRKLISIT